MNYLHMIAEMHHLLERHLRHAYRARLGLAVLIHEPEMRRLEMAVHGSGRAKLVA